MVNKYNVNISEDTACHISNKNILNKGHISYVDAAMIPEYMWRWEQASAWMEKQTIIIIYQKSLWRKSMPSAVYTLMQGSCKPRRNFLESEGFCRWRSSSTA